MDDDSWQQRFDMEFGNVPSDWGANYRLSKPRTEVKNFIKQELARFHLMTEVGKILDHLDQKDK